MFCIADYNMVIVSLLCRIDVVSRIPAFQPCGLGLIPSGVRNFNFCPGTGCMSFGFCPVLPLVVALHSSDHRFQGGSPLCFV